MAIECGVITVLFVLIAVIFFRRKQKEWALAVLPLMLVPLTDFLLELLIIRVMKVEVDVFGGVLALLIAVAVSAAWIGAASQNLKSKKTGATYIAITNVFNVALAAILINTFLAVSV